MYPVVPSHPTEHSEWYSKDHTPEGKSQSYAIVEQKAQLYKSIFLNTSTLFFHGITKQERSQQQTSIREHVLCSVLTDKMLPPP